MKLNVVGFSGKVKRVEKGAFVICLNKIRGEI